MNVYKEKSQLIFKKDEEDFLIFDFKDNSFYNKSNKKIKHPQPFFKGIVVKDVLEGVEDVKYKNFLNKIVRAEERCSNMGTFLERLKKYSHLEAWALLGIDTDCKIKLKTQDVTKDILRLIKTNNIKIDSFSETALKDISIHKHLLFISEEYGEYYLSKYINVFYYKRDAIKNLINKHNYEYKTLINYIFRISENEGLEVTQVVEFLNDYAEMQSIIKNGKYDKYPKYLHSVHDIIAKNYKLNKQKYDEIVFTQNINIELEYFGKGFSVITPKTTKDIIDEGMKLSHCVASYIDRVIRKECIIVFLREKVEESLVTVEIKKGNITQAKGYLNRGLTEQENKWLNIYAKAKNLKIKGVV